MISLNSRRRRNGQISIWVSCRGMADESNFTMQPVVAPFLHHPLSNDESLFVFGKTIEDAYRWFQWKKRYVMFNRGKRKNRYTCPLEKLPTAIRKKRLSLWERATPVAPDIEELWRDLYIESTENYTIQYHDSVLQRRLPFLATCDSCGYTAAEHTFQIDKDLFGNPYISYCPNCKRRRAPGDMAVLGDNLLTFTVRPQDSIIYWGWVDTHGCHTRSHYQSLGCTRL